MGESCAWCEEAIVFGDDGLLIPVAGENREISYHTSCFLRSVVGSVGHQQNCNCRGECGGDPEGMTKKEAAQAAVDYFQSRRFDAP